MPNTTTDTLDSLDKFRAWRRRPTYKKVRSDPSTYLTTARQRLLATLPPTHRLCTRATETGTLKLEIPPNPPRPPFTEEELKNIKAKRRTASDPDNVRYQLQESKLVDMWNADSCEREEQWREYDLAKPVMEGKRDGSAYPDEAFDSEDVVGEKRKRAISGTYRGPAVRQKVRHDHTEGEKKSKGDEELEEGEIGIEEQEESKVKKLRETNEMLSAANAALRIMAEGVTQQVPSSPMRSSFPASQLALSPPESDQTDSSDCDSDDSAKAVCGDETEDTNARKPVQNRDSLDSWLETVKARLERQGHTSDD